MDRLARRHTDNVIVLAIGIDQETDLGNAFLDEIVPNRSFRVAWDPGGSFFARLGAPAMPSTWVIDHKGKVQLVIPGSNSSQLGKLDEIISALSHKTQEKTQ